MAQSMRVLGHSTTSAALIYQRLAVDPVRRAASAAADDILGKAGVRKRAAKKQAAAVDREAQ